MILSAAADFKMPGFKTSWAALDPFIQDKDRAINKKLQEAFNIVGIDMLDSIIIGRNGYYSAKEHGELFPESKYKESGAKIMESNKESNKIEINLEQEEDACGVAMEAAMDVVSERCSGDNEPEQGRFLRMQIKQEIKHIHALALGTVTHPGHLIRDPASIGCPDAWIKSKDAAFMDDIRGAHHGQVDGTLIAYDIKTSTTIGYIDYSIFEGKLYLNNIEVGSSHRRQGYATALLLKLKQLNPGMPVKWGMMTELGCALKSAVDKESPDNPSGVKVYYKGVLGEKHEKYRSGTICDKLKRMDEFRVLIKRVSAESEYDKIERSFDICKNDKGNLTFSAPRKGHVSCIDYRDTCPPGTKKIADVHTHPTALVNPSVGDYISSIKNNQKMFCIAGNDPYKNNVLTVKCYSVPEELFTEKDTVKKHNKITDLVRSENSICMIRYPPLARTGVVLDRMWGADDVTLDRLEKDVEQNPQFYAKVRKLNREAGYIAESGLVTRNMTCYKCGEMLQRKLNADQKTITCPSCQNQIEIKKAEELDKDLASRLEREQREGVVRERREYTKADRIAMAKAIAVTTGERMEQGVVITLDDIDKLSREEKIKAIDILLGPRQIEPEVVQIHKTWTFDDFINVINRTISIEDLAELRKHISESEATTPRQRIELHKIAEQREVEIRSTGG